MRTSSLLTAAVIFSLTTALTASAGPLAPTKAKQIVTLVPGPGGTVCPPFDEEMSLTIDDLGEDVPFTLPPGKVLMVTDILWMLDSTPGENAGFYIGSGSNVEQQIFAVGDVNPKGLAHGELHYQSPIRFTELPCVNLVGIGGSPIPSLHEMRLTGFIAADR